MKGKKGLDFIDWSISMGIFIIAIVAIFTFLKPGATPPQDADTLLSMIEKNLMEKTTWYVHETPLFVKQLQDKYVSGSTPQDALIDISSDGDMLFTTTKPDTNAKYSKILLSASHITLHCKYDCAATNFTIFGTTSKSSDSIQLSIQCTPSGKLSVCDAVLGATETYTGLQQKLLNDLKTQGYAAVKKTWTYPLQRDFAIYQDNNKLIGAQEPAQQANVFVKEVKTIILDPTGIQAPTTINIRVW